MACHHGTAGAHQSSKILYVYPSLSDVRNITFLQNINRQQAFFFFFASKLLVPLSNNLILTVDA